MRTHVAVVVLNWNSPALTVQCIRSVRESAPPGCQIIVIDNGSADGSASAIRAQCPDVALVRNSANLGFAEGSNLGIRHAVASGADYVLLLNNDTVVDKEMILLLVETAAAHRNMAAVSPKMINGFQSDRLWFVRGKTNLWAGIFSNPEYNLPADKPFEPVVRMEYASGCCILIPRQMVEAVGELDPRFFAYCEDVEWSMRARRAGFGLLCDTRAKLWHYVASTGGKNPPLMRYLMTRNHIWTLRKHASRLQFAVFATVFYPPRCALRLGKAVAHRQWSCIPAEFRGAWHGFLSPL